MLLNYEKNFDYENFKVNFVTKNPGDEKEIMFEINPESSPEIEVNSDKDFAKSSIIEPGEIPVIKQWLSNNENIIYNTRNAVMRQILS